VDYEIRETFESAIAFGSEALRSLGLNADEVDGIVEEVRRRDADRLALQRRDYGREREVAGKVSPEPFVQPRRQSKIWQALSAGTTTGPPNAKRPPAE
jgi:hypothetical protein